MDMKALTDLTGEKAKPINPHKNQFGGIPLSGKGYADWLAFDKAHPSLPLTERQLPNVIIEVMKVWQYKFGSFTWVEPAFQTRPSKTFADFQLYWFDRDTRQAYKTITQIDEEKGLEDDIYDAVADYRKTHTQPVENKSQLDEEKGDNVLIAEFMNCKVSNGIAKRLDNTNSSYVEDLKYNTSWDWLMPVIEKIESFGYIFFIGKKEAGIAVGRSSGLPREAGSNIKADTKINAAYQSVIQFIKYYNTQNS